jgi:protein-tyrosine phosphatase
MKVLMVCLGNICRSPLAEGILKNKVEKEGLNWTVDSAGTGDYHVGNMPDSRSIAVASKYQIDISNQKARQFKTKDFTEFDLILVMDASNYRNVVNLARNEEDSKKVDLIMNLLIPGQNIEVPDPYWNNDGFEQVFAMLDNACDKLIDKYKG